MRIQSESSPGHSPVLRAVTRTCISLALGMAALSAGACARNQAVQPESRLGAISPAERQATWHGSSFYGHYEKEVNRESAFELLQQRAAAVAEQQAQTPPPARRAAPQQSDGAELVEAFAKSAVR